MSVSDIDVFDLYSCFGSAVQFARDALGICHDDPRPISLTGGLPYHGGPSSNYMGHSISHLFDYLRANPLKAGMVTGVGMHMTKHVAAIYSPIPGPILWKGDESSTQQWRAPSEVQAPSFLTRSLQRYIHLRSHCPSPRLERRHGAGLAE